MNNTLPDMEKKSNWKEFESLLSQYNIKKLYHFTDRENLESIIKNGGRKDNLQHFVRISFTSEHPMMYVAMQDGRLSNPVILEIDPEVIFWQTSKYANMNATKTGANIGSTIDDFKKIHFNSVKARKHFDLADDEQPYFQAEILVKNFIPLEYIKNIGNFGIPIHANPKQLHPWAERQRYLENR